MSLSDEILQKLQTTSLFGSICIDLGNTQIAVDSDGKILSDTTNIDCTLSLSQETLQGIVDGSIDAMNAYFSGDLKITGDLAVAMSLSKILKQS
jgi:putative sterol carrier protein